MPVSSRERNRRVVASAGFGVFQRVVQVASTLIVMPLMLRALGPAKFGVWGAGSSLAWISGLVDIGTGSALVTLVARALARDHADEARQHITGGFTVGACLSCLMLAVVLAVRAFSKNQSDVYLIALLGLALNITLGSANNVWMALQKGYISGWWELVQTILTTAGLVWASMSTTDVRVYVAIVYGGLLAANFGSLLHLFLAHPELRPRELPRSFVSAREVVNSGILFFALSLAGGASYMFDNILTLQWLGPSASAAMTIAMRICMTAFGVLAVLAQPLWPAFTNAAHVADRRWIRRTLLRGTVFLSVSALLGSLLLVSFGESFLRLWLHGRLGIDRLLLVAVAGWVISQALVRVASVLLNALSLLRFQIIVTTFATMVAFGAKRYLAPHLGAAGILWGTSLAVFLIAFPASVWRIYSWADHHAKQRLSFAEQVALDSVAPH